MRFAELEMVIGFTEALTVTATGLFLTCPIRSPPNLLNLHGIWYFDKINTKIQAVLWENASQANCSNGYNKTPGYNKTLKAFIHREISCASDFFFSRNSIIQNGILSLIGWRIIPYLTRQLVN